jgi:hypothetical protein
MAVQHQTNHSAGAVGAAVPRLLLVVIGPSATGKSSLPRGTATAPAGRCGPAELAARLDGRHRELAAGRRVAHRVIVNDRPLPDLADVATAALRLDLARYPVHQGGLAC